GIGPGGTVCFSMTEAGRYLLREAVDFDLAEEPAGRIVAQPNFDVVFLAPARTAEIELARFCERKGRRVGTVFTITKRSIQAAAASGSANVLESLKKHCGELPQNVEKEIAGWLGRCREVSLRSAMLIECPDAETALR